MEGEVFRRDDPRLTATFDQTHAAALEQLRNADVFYVVTAREGERPEWSSSSKGTWPIPAISSFFAQAAKGAVTIAQTIIEGDGKVEL